MKGNNRIEKIREIELCYKMAEDFEKVRHHMESVSEEDVTNEDVAIQLIRIGIQNYRFL